MKPSVPLLIDFLQAVISKEQCYSLLIDTNEKAPIAGINIERATNIDLFLWLLRNVSSCSITKSEEFFDFGPEPLSHKQASDNLASYLESVNNLLINLNPNDIPYSSIDARGLTFSCLLKESDPE